MTTTQIIITILGVLAIFNTAYFYSKIKEETVKRIKTKILRFWCKI